MSQIDKGSKTGISSLYVLKALGAFLVVFCHVRPEPLQCIFAPLRLAAVPLFFLISGYFLYSPDRTKVEKRLIKSLRKVLLIALLLNLFYFLWLLPNNGIVVGNWRHLVYGLYLGNIFSGHLWYLSAMVEALAIFYLLVRLWGLRSFYIFPLLLLLTLGYGNYSLYCIDWLGTGRVLGVYGEALPFMSIGYLLHKYEANIPNIGWGWVFALLFVLGIGEWYWLIPLVGPSPSDPYASSVLMAIVLMAWALKYKDYGEGSKLFLIGRDYSSNIYYFHIAISTVIWKITTIVGLRSVMESQAEVLIVFAFSLIFAIGAERINQFCKRKFLREKS